MCLEKEGRCGSKVSSMVRKNERMEGVLKGGSIYGNREEGVWIRGEEGMSTMIGSWMCWESCRGCC